MLPMGYQYEIGGRRGSILAVAQAYCAQKRPA